MAKAGSKRSTKPAISLSSVDIQTTYSHWTLPECQSLYSKRSYGFIYKIQRDDGKFYIGQKGFSTGTPWPNYCSSSTELKQDIKELGKNRFSFNMLFTMPDKANLNLAELYTQVYENVIFEYLDGNCYNKTVIGKTFFGTSSKSRESLDIIGNYLTKE